MAEVHQKNNVILCQIGQTGIWTQTTDSRVLGFKPKISWLYTNWVFVQKAQFEATDFKIIILSETLFELNKLLESVTVNKALYVRVALQIIIHVHWFEIDCDYQNVENWKIL